MCFFDGDCVGVLTIAGGATGRCVCGWCLGRGLPPGYAVVLVVESGGMRSITWISSAVRSECGQKVRKQKTAFEWAGEWAGGQLKEHAVGIARPLE